MLEWVYDKEGTFYDEDGAHGSQCVDLFTGLLSEVFEVNVTRGNAKDYIHNDLPNEYFTRYAKEDIPGKKLKPGDVVMWDGTSNNPNGHIAIVIEVEDEGYTTMDANWPEKSGIPKNDAGEDNRPVSQVQHSRHDYWGIIRPPYADELPVQENDGNIPEDSMVPIYTDVMGEQCTNAGQSTAEFVNPFPLTSEPSSLINSPSVILLGSKQPGLVVTGRMFDGTP